MNAKLKTILHTAWTEPRHFFFWLSVLSLCGFIVVAAATGFSSPPRLLAFVALFCAVCVVMGAAAFILAWIPPARRSLAWLLERRFLVLGCMITLIALF